jgi:hypothetical protein
MPTVQEILRQSGFRDSEIEVLDERAKVAFTNVLQQAQAEREQAELQKTSVDEFWRNTYNPGIAAWEQERAEVAKKIAAAEAKAAYLERERQALRESGLVSDDLPNFTPGRGSSGRFTSGAGTTPGTPTFVDPNEFVGRAAQGLAQIADVDYRHRALYNQPMPVTPSQLIQEADKLGISPTEYAERKFGFSKRESEIAAQRAKEHDDKIRTETRAQADREWAERTGSNPDVRQPQGSSKYAEIRRAVKQGERPDPTKLTPEQRRRATLDAIHKDIERRESIDA